MSRAIALLLLVTATARAELKVDLRIDLPVTGAAIGFWVATELSKRHLAPSTCRWCDEELNPLDRGLRDLSTVPDRGAARTASDLLTFGGMPLIALGTVALAAGRDLRWRTFLVAALLIAEATALASDLNQAVKFAAGRQRPFVRALPADERRPDPDDHLSFFSGHTTFAFALAASAGTVATLRGYRFARAVWAVGMPVAALCGWLRVAGDKHYLSDVFVGSAIGTAVGVAIPWLHRVRSPVVPVAGGVPGGATAGLAGVW